MKILKIGSTGPDVKRLQLYLGIKADGNFGPGTLKSVKDFQGSDADGIVGLITWLSLYRRFREGGSSISWSDYDFVSYLIGCEIRALRAVKQVETGGNSGFLKSGRPAILFEGHVFWNQLKKSGDDPKKYVPGNSDILFPSYDRNSYKGGEKEWDRLNRAIQINKEIALSSASWGMFQILGLNWKSCGCSDVLDFSDKMSTSQFEQLLLSALFIMSSKKIVTALVNKDWISFAKLYNGPGYATNQYDNKLEKAYKDGIFS